MPSLLLKLTLILMLAAFAPSNLYAFEPGELIQWGQEERFVGKLRFRGFLQNDQPAQIDRPRSKPPALTQLDTAFQYRIFEDPKWGKFECASQISLFTHWDVPDRINIMAECGDTLFERFRIEIGHLRILNIGTSSGERGISAYWLGGSVKILEGQKFFIDGYARYYLGSSIPARIKSRFGKDDDQAVAEIGARAKYDIWKYAYIFAAPYVFLDTSFEPSRVGAYAGLNYAVGKHIGFMPNVSVELAGNYNINTDFKNDESMIWFALKIELK